MKEYMQSLSVTFIDYEVFDSIEINSVLNSLEIQGIKAQYIELLKEAKSNCTNNIALLSLLWTVPVGKSINLGNSLPEAFHHFIQGGINIDHELLTHVWLHEN